jgi:hypothetical protein
MAAAASAGGDDAYLITIHRGQAHDANHRFGIGCLVAQLQLDVGGKALGGTGKHGCRAGMQAGRVGHGDGF